MSSMATFSFSGGARSCGLLLLLAAAAVLTCAAGAKIAELTSLQAPKAVSGMDAHTLHVWHCTPRLCAVCQT